jgi:hypothetical protein
LNQNNIESAPQLSYNLNMDSVNNDDDKKLEEKMEEESLV